MMASIATLRPPPSREVGEGDMREVGPSKEVLKRRGNAERAMEAMGIIKQQVVEVLKDYADKVRLFHFLWREMTDTSTGGCTDVRGGLLRTTESRNWFRQNVCHSGD